MSKKRLKVGIVGLGTIGPYHAKAYASTGEVDIVAGCDVNAERLADRCDKLDIKNRFTDLREMLKSDVEAVSVCVGNNQHRDLAVAALEAGKHVLLEKPMALNAGEAAEIVAASKKAKGVLQIGMVQRQSLETRIVKEYVDAGLFGEIYHMRAVYVRRRGIPGLGGWFTTMAESGGGPMIDLGVHFLDAAMHVSGHWKPTSVSAKTYAKFGPKMKDYTYVNMWAGPPKFDGTFDVEDYSTGFVRYGDKATLSFEFAWAANAPENTYIEILGDKGGARIFDSGPLQILTEHNGRLTDIAPKFDKQANAMANRFNLQAAAFVAACRGEAPPAATGEQGLVLMKLIDAIYASSKANKEVEISV